MKKSIILFPTIFINKLLKILQNTKTKDEVKIILHKKYNLNEKQIEYILSYKLKDLLEQLPDDYKIFMAGLKNLEK